MKKKILFLPLLVASFALSACQATVDPIDTTSNNGSSNTNSTTTNSTSTMPAIYEVVFNPNGAMTGPAKQQVAAGQTAREPEASELPVMEYYDFGYWSEVKEGSGVIPFSFDTPIVKNTILYAQWNKTVYHIHLDYGYDIPNGSHPVRYEEEINLPTPERPGYTFTGWRTGSATGPAYTTQTWLSNEDTTVYASWAAKDYFITFDYNGGVCDITVIDNPCETILDKTTEFRVTFDQSYNPGLVLAKTGHDFDGWFYEGIKKVNNLGRAVDPAGNVGGVYDIPNNVIYVAQFTPKIYNFTYSVESETTYPETLPIDTPEFATITYGQTFQLAVPTKKGHSFNYWYDAADPEETALTDEFGVALANYLRTDHLTIKPHFTPNSYNVEGLNLNAGEDPTIAFPDGGALPSIADPITFDTAFILPEVTRTGYAFLGWYYTDSNLIEQEYTTDVWNIDHDVNEFYCKWDPYKTVITFDPNNGTMPDNFEYDETELEDVYQLTLEYDQEYTLPEPTLYGYKFAGWYYYDETITPDPEPEPEPEPEPDTPLPQTIDSNALLVPLTGDKWEICDLVAGTVRNLELIANWKALTGLSVTLDMNGGVDKVDGIPVRNSYDSLEFNAAYTFTPTSRAGYFFVGWGLLGEGDDYELITNNTGYVEHWPFAESITLHAIWAVDMIFVEFNLTKGLDTDNFTVKTPDFNGYIPIDTENENGDRPYIHVGMGKFTLPRLKLTAPTDQYVFAGWEYELKSGKTEEFIEVDADAVTNQEFGKVVKINALWEQPSACLSYTYIDLTGDVAADNNGTIPGNKIIVADYFDVSGDLKPVTIIANGICGPGTPSDIKKIVIPDTIKKINVGGDDGTGFSGTGITNFMMPSKLEFIGPYAFAYCASLSLVIMPDSLKKIEARAFNVCGALTEIRISPNSSLETIGERAFNQCTNASIYLPYTIDAVGEFAFGNWGKNTKIYLGFNSTQTPLPTWFTTYNWPTDYENFIYLDTVQ